MAASVSALAEEQAKKLIVQGVKPMFALRRAGLAYGSDSLDYRRVLRAASIISCFVSLILLMLFW